MNPALSSTPLQSAGPEGATRREAERAACGEVPHLAGIMRAGMLDWPGKVTATAFLSGCTLRCPFCHNPELIHSGRARESADSLIALLRERRGWLDGVVVTGGEPTAAPGIALLLKRIKAEGVAVKLDTNGTSPEVLTELIGAGLVDFVALDVKATPERYSAATGREGVWGAVEQSIAAIIGSGVDHEFRTTCYPLAVAPGDPLVIAKRLRGGRRYALQQFRSVRTLDPGAASVRPHSGETLKRAADSCSAFIPTSVRGV